MNKLCIDLGGTKTAVAVYNDLEEETFYTVFLTEPANGFENWLERLSTIVRGQSFSSGCIASPGPLDLKTGSIINAVTMGWKNIPLIEVLESKFGCEFYLVNDCNAGVLGVWREKCKQYQLKNVAYLSVSTGVGGGLILNGELYTGRGNAAEFGHVRVVENEEERPCACGKTDCLELYASGSGVERLFFEQTGIAMTCRDIAYSAKNGDTVSKDLLVKAGHALNVFVKNLNTIMDLDAIYVGGSVTKSDIVFDEITKNTSNVFRASTDDKQVIRGALEFLTRQH